ncbi:hypothetical protein TRFO_17577 [Tritrichomonas foetus]|uniref:Phosphatidic acid phosphatase type 2/haloperoxidase domain-containing protein n=1 Tax=Tritrichomonas foetus TaxID=1144522 RepID=A0A1J4KMR6_9EUKA|nr:hypothetical protein TRFO_17577 [Tritrichomonas foetus]|eukprot:OHT12531.1 hypothetical protein TRFO_17577 [Tritrichomonas foetus]
MWNAQPIPPKPRRKEKLLMTQSHFWDVINSIELPIIIFLQKYLFAYTSTKKWNKVTKLASPRMIRFLPIIFYSIGLQDKAKILSLSLVYFALFSSFGKYLIKRRRPGSYPNIHAPDCAPTSSFPSRHTISVTVVASFFPFSNFWICLIVVSRVMLGMHFISDCVLGVAIGKIALFVAPRITDPNYCLFLLLITFRVWSGCFKILCGALPILITQNVKCCPLFSVILLLWPFIRSFWPGMKRASALELLVIETIPFALLTFLINAANFGSVWLFENHYIQFSAEECWNSLVNSTMSLANKVWMKEL